MMILQSARGRRSGAIAAVRGWRWRTQGLGAALMAGAMMLVATAAQAALQVCSVAGTPPVGTINHCCRITKPGDYTVAGPLTSSGGTCIKIAAAGVVLDGNGQTITGVGIRLTPAAAGAVVHDVADISTFKTGISDDAPGSVITSTGSANGTVEQSAGNGILIRANRVYLARMSSDRNHGNGVVVRPLAPASLISKAYLGYVGASDNDEGGLVLKSLTTSTVWKSQTLDNRGDGVDLTDSVDTSITDVISNGNTGDGIKVVGGHDDVVNDGWLGVFLAPSPNEIGLEVRNSAFDTIDDDNIEYNSGDGLLIVNGKGEDISDISANDNNGNGVHLKRTKSSRIHESNSNSNALAGIWLDGSQGISVEGSSSYNNGKSGAYIGCSPAQEPSGTKCASLGLPASNGNRVAQSRFSGCDVGIGIDLANHHNQVLQNDATGNVTDLMDERGNCDSNVWMFNTFDTANPPEPSCIQ